jgi:hypothetical protein
VKNVDWTISTNGWQTITFDSPFVYNGTDNLLLIWENRDGDWTSGYGWAKCWFDNTHNESWRLYQDYTYPAGTDYGTADVSYRPNTRFDY